MISVNIPTSVYVNLLIILIIAVLLFGGFFSLNPELSKLIRLGVIWAIVLVVINLVNIIITLKHYEKNKNKIGKKGPVGQKGLKGIRGEGLSCGSICGSGGMLKKSTRTTNLDKNTNEIKDENIEAVDRKCIFPFTYGYQKFNKCVEPNDVPESIKNLEFYQNHNNRYNGRTGTWCATSINQETHNGNNVKTWGVCTTEQESAIISANALRDQKKKRKEAEYIRRNKGLLDLRAVTSNRSNILCPAGYEKIPGDLNFAAGGKYINLCKKEGLGTPGIKNVREVDTPDKCNSEGEEVVKEFSVEKNEVIGDADFNKDLEGGDPVYLCMTKTATPDQNGYIKEMHVYPYFDPEGNLVEKCNINNVASNKIRTLNGLNKGHPQEVSVCYTLTGSNTPLIDTAFVWDKDSKLYFFIGDNYYKYDESNKILFRNLPPNKRTVSRNEKMQYDIIKGNTIDMFGKMKTSLNSNNINNLMSANIQNKLRLDGAFTWRKDGKTYFFKDKFVYQHDSENNKIAKGYPKFINQVFNGVPDNIDAVFTWGLDRKTYFFKNSFYYRFDDLNNRVERGYPKKISFRWGDSAPNKINAIWTSKFDKSTYAISGRNYYKVTSESMELLGDISEFEIDKIV